MARKITVIDKPSTAKKFEVPADVATELKDIATKLAANPLQIAKAEFDNTTELNLYVKQAKAWATENKHVYRKHALKNAPATTVAFTLVTQAKADAQQAALDELKAKRATKKAANEKKANAPKPAPPKNNRKSA